jgi:hypothetical protein
MMQALLRPLVQTGWLLVLAIGLAWSPAQAHKGSDAYLDVQQSDATGAESAGTLRDLRFVLAVAIRDLDLVVPMDGNADGRVTWGEVKAATPQALALFNQQARLDVPAGTPGACRLDWQTDGLERRSDGVYLRATATARCPVGQDLRFSYLLLKDQDSTHRLLVAGRIGGKDLLSTMSPQQDSFQPLVGAARLLQLGRSPLAAGLRPPGFSAGAGTAAATEFAA